MLVRVYELSEIKRVLKINQITTLILVHDKKTQMFHLQTIVNLPQMHR